MRWLPFFITAYFCQGLQLGLGAFAQVRGVSPNFMLILVVFFALNAPREPALMAGLILGLATDLTTLQPLGLYAFSFGLVAALVARSAEFVRRGHPLTHGSLTLVGGGVVAAVVLVGQLVHPVGPADPRAGVHAGVVRIGLRVLLISAVYTAVLSPALIGVLQRFPRFFGFDATRRRNRV